MRGERRRQFGPPPRPPSSAPGARADVSAQQLNPAPAPPLAPGPAPSTPGHAPIPPWPRPLAPPASASASPAPAVTTTWLRRRGCPCACSCSGCPGGSRAGWSPTGAGASPRTSSAPTRNAAVSARGPPGPGRAGAGAGQPARRREAQPGLEGGAPRRGSGAEPGVPACVPGGSAGARASRPRPRGLRLPLVAGVLFFLCCPGWRTWGREVVGGLAMAPVIPGQLPASAPLVCPAPMGAGVARRGPRASHAASESLPAPAAGPGGCCPRADALRARGADALLHVDDRFREGRCPCALLLRSDWGACRLLDGYRSLGLGQPQSPGTRRIPGSPSRSASVLSFRCWKSCRQPGGEGAGEATVFGSESVGGSASATWDPHSLLVSVQEAELFPCLRLVGAGGGCDG